MEDKCYDDIRSNRSSAPGGSLEAPVFQGSLGKLIEIRHSVQHTHILDVPLIVHGCLEHHRSGSDTVDRIIWIREGQDSHRGIVLTCVICMSGGNHRREPFCRRCSEGWKGPWPVYERHCHARRSRLVACKCWLKFPGSNRRFCRTHHRSGISETFDFFDASVVANIHVHHEQSIEDDGVRSVCIPGRRHLCRAVSLLSQRAWQEEERQQKKSSHVRNLSPRRNQMWSLGAKGRGIGSLPVLVFDLSGNGFNQEPCLHVGSVDFLRQLAQRYLCPYGCPAVSFRTHCKLSAYEFEALPHTD